MLRCSVSDHSGEFGGGMERQMKKCRQRSTENAMKWIERLPKQQDGKVQVVYYLSRNHRLQHPHFIQVPLSAPDGLYLRDVIERLKVLRGRCMPAMYAWSCKRSYKNGYVWHDLCKDDLILPAHGHEYILKGSELIEQSHSVIESSVGDNASLPELALPSDNINIQNAKQLRQPTSSTVTRETKSHLEEKFSPPHQCTGSSAMSPHSRIAIDLSRVSSRNLTKYNVYKGIGAADASTQTEEIIKVPRVRGKCMENDLNHVSEAKENPEFYRDEISPPPPSSSTSSSGRRTVTLESLMRADCSKMSGFRMLEEKVDNPLSTHNRSVNVLMHLISCGSISVKDRSFNLIPSYRPRFSSSKLLSLFFSSSVMSGEVDCVSEKPRVMGLSLTMEDKEYISGSLVESKADSSEVNGHNTLKRSSSYNADRICSSANPIENFKETSFAHSKCIPQSIKAALSKPLRKETMKSPASEGRRKSSAEVDSSQPIPSPSAMLSNSSTKDTTETPSTNILPQTGDSFRREGKVIQIEQNFLQELGL